MAKTATKAKTPPKPAPRPAAQRSAPTAPANRKAPEPAEERRANQVATRQSSTALSEAAANLPAHMREDMGMGKENISQEDMDIPRLKLIQGLSKELTLYDGLKAGNFFHTATEAIFDDSIRVVPLLLDKQYILWRPLEDGGGILARASDGVHWQPSAGEFEVKLDKKDGGHKVKWKLARTVQESGLANWGTMNPNDTNSPPAATLMYNFLLAFPDEPDMMPAVLTFQRSSIKIGRKFMTKLRTVRTPLFGSVFKLSSFVDHNSANQDFHNISIVGDGLVEDTDLYNAYKEMHLAMKSKGLNIRDVDSLQDEPDAAAGGDEPEGGGNY